MKIAVLGNQARAMSNFWTVLLRELVAAGHEVICLVPEPGGEDPAWERALADLGPRLAHYPLDRKGLNPLRDLRTLLALRRTLRREACDSLFAYTIKPVIYGALASALAGSPVKARRALMITGLGYMFEADSLPKRLLTQLARLLYRAAFQCAGLVFFQNSEDEALFRRLSIIPKGLTVRRSKGCGVDAERFRSANPPGDAPSFLFVGRLLEAKGLRDLAAAAKIVRAKYPDCAISILGPEEHGPGAVPPREVRQWEAEGLLRYLGETRDVRPYLEQAAVVVLPSWREGTPGALLEAMSMGRAVIAADAPGSREVVRPGVNGFLVPLRDPEALAAAMESCILDPALVRRLGAAGRALAEGEFSALAVARAIMREMGIAGANAANLL